MEYGTARDVFAQPQHPYTWGLLGSMPRIDRERSDRLLPIPGSPPSLINVPSGCAFHPRCAYEDRTDGLARTERPELREACAGSPGRLPSSGRGAPEDLRRGDRAQAVTADVLLSAEKLQMHFPVRRGLLRRKVGAVQAVDGLTFDVRRGETLSLVGESGCGKTTTGRLLTRLLEPTDGTVTFEGRDISHLGVSDMRPLRRDIQMVFQDPYSSLNPRHTVGTIVGAPYRIQGVEPQGRGQAGGAGSAGAGRAVAGALQPLPARVLRRASASASGSRARWRCGPS